MAALTNIGEPWKFSDVIWFLLTGALRLVPGGTEWVGIKGYTVLISIVVREVP